MNDIAAFDPPYSLGALGCVAFGIWRSPRGPSPVDLFRRRGLDAFAPLRVPGGVLGVAFVLRYDRPAVEHPVPYSEVIAAYAVRRGARFAAVPFDLVLDDPFTVDAGRVHYHLPKRLDRTFAVDLANDGRTLRASGADVRFCARLGDERSTPLPRLVSLAFREVTKLGPVLGALEEPLIETSIPLTPDPATARAASVTEMSIGDYELTPLRAQFWGSVAVTLGPPHPVS